MDKFDKKLKEITEGLMSTQNEAIIESHFEHMNEGMPSKVKILNALKNMSAEEVAKKFNIRLADVKQIEKETMNEARGKDEYAKMLSDLQNGLITPRSVVGGGYRDGKKVATQWIVSQLLKDKLNSNKFNEVFLGAKGKGFPSLQKALSSKIPKAINTAIESYDADNVPDYDWSFEKVDGIEGGALVFSYGKEMRKFLQDKKLML